MASAIQFEPEVIAPEPQVDRESWRFIDVRKIKDLKAKRVGHRLNCLGSLYYFTTFALRKHRLTQHLHLPICLTLEKDSLKELLEIPRDHFKSTICSEAAPMWWALPFTDEDREYLSLHLKYSDEFIRWMERAHDQNTRTLLVSENIENATKLASRIEKHYRNNDLFRLLFPEILPDTSCVWNAHSMTHMRTRNSSPQGEGTYDVLGVGGALQSRHYIRVIQDDIVGRKALDSDVVMEDTINYHKLLVGAFDADPKNAGRDNDEVIVGNRWSWKDLNSYIREEESYFNITNHSAIGGCCDLHPFGKPIFPEEFTLDKLHRWEKRLGAYYYSCQFLNAPTAPGNTFFKEKDLRFFDYKTISKEDLRIKIVHEVLQGEVIKDLMPANLSISMVVDPNHAGNDGRCRHAITVTGVSNKPFRIYLLDIWAESCGYEQFVAKIFELAKKWKLRRVWLETIAAQKYLKAYLDYKKQVDKVEIKFEELKTDKTANAKARRIESLSVYTESNQLWVPKFGERNAQFMGEYLSYPHGKTKDILDTLGYAPQTWTGHSSFEEVVAFVNRQKNNFGGSMRTTTSSVTGY